MKSKRIVIGVSTGAFLVLLAWAGHVLGYEQVPVTQSQQGEVRRSQPGLAEPVAVLPSEPMPGRVTAARAVVRVVGRGEMPVRGAAVRFDGITHTTDDEGTVELVVDAEGESIEVSCDGYMTESRVHLTAYGALVRLRSAITVEVRAMDADSGPVANARLWSSPFRVSESELDSESGSPSAVTDARGRATIGPIEFPEGGILFFQACHDELAYCRHAQEGQQSVVFREPGNHEVVARFLTPLVIALQPPETGVVTWKLQLLGNAIRPPENREASWTCEQIADRIRKMYPGALVRMALPAYPPHTDKLWDPRVTVWLVGRQPFTVPCPAVRVDEFVAPQRMKPPSGMIHDGFGSLRAIVTDAAGEPLPMSTYRWIGDLTEDWPGDRSLVVKPKGEDTEGWMTLPTGTWRVDFYDPVLRALAEGQASATVPLAKGGRAEARVVFARKLVKCRFEASFEGDGPRPTAGVVRLQNAECGLDIPFLRNTTLQPFDLLVPEGENTVVVEARTTQTGPVLTGRSVISVRADESAPAPVVRVLLVRAQ